MSTQQRTTDYRHYWSYNQNFNDYELFGSKMKMRMVTYLSLAALVAAGGCATLKTGSKTADQFLGSWVAQEFSSDLAKDDVRQAIKWITFKSGGQVEWRFESLDTASPFAETHSGSYMIVDGCFYDGAKPSDTAPGDNPMILQNMKIEQHPRFGRILKAETSDGLVVMFVEKQE